MKKLLLLSLAAMAGFTAGAAVPTVIEDTYANGISPNGLWGVSYYYGVCDIVNLTTGQTISVAGEDEGFGTGDGYNISNDGILVGSYFDNAAWFVNGQISILNDATLNYGMSNANSITPDGKRMVGYCQNPNEAPGNMDVTMAVPVMWDVNPDGTVADPVFLPYPALDITGRAPQYIIANTISDDGRIVAGHIVDNAGSLCYPILFTQADDNTWSYSLPAEKYVNPNHIEFPEVLPAPEWINPESYLTPEELAAYNAQLDIYYQTWDEADFPTYEQFMSPEELAAYTAAKTAYDAANDAYLTSLYAFQDAYYQMLEESVVFINNSAFLSPDCKTLVCGAQLPKDAPWDPSVFYTTIINLETGALTKSQEGLSIIPTSVAADGTIVADSPQSIGGTPVRSYILTPGATEFITVEDYMAATNPEIAEWITENLVRDYILYDPETYEPSTIEYPYTGIYFFSRDMTTFIAGVQPLWEGFEAEHSYFFSYTSSGLTTALKGATIAKDNVTITGQLGGTILIAGNASTVEVYDLAGRKVFAADAAPALTTGLPSGLYIVKTEGPAGTTTAKVTL